MRPGLRRFRLAHTFVAAALGVATLAMAATGSVSRAQAAASGTADSVWLVPITSEINSATAHFVKARIQRANKEKPLALLFYLDTPGGQITAMQQIVDAILNDAQVPTLAVAQNAFSAGALVAMSAEKLAMLPGSSIGAALPITLTPSGAKPVNEKFNSAMRGEFRSVAEARGRNAQVAAGMVDQTIAIPGIATDKELVTLTAQEAVANNIANIQASSVQDALQQWGYGGAAIQRLTPTLSERLASLLTNPIAAAALLVIGIGGLLIEIFTPGFGVPGGLGLVALALLAAGAFIATPAGPLDIVLIIVGVLLLAAEVLVIPGFGVAGVLGIAAVVIAVVRIFQGSAASVLGYSALFGGVLVAALLWILPNSKVAAAFRLSTRLTNPPSPVTPDTPWSADRAYLAGREGVALSDLRPAGVARFENERVDVVSEGDFVAAGSRITVLRVEGMRVIVRQKAPEPDSEPAA
ncbi:MAG TPA: NfeD family protein [Trueperaceae bacterium]|nr:NfeD family protein [Trueperaceae bacterium]